MASAQQVLETIREKRGYVLPMHEVLADLDPDFLEAYDSLYTATMDDNASPLSRKTRELILIAADMCLGSPPDVIKGHVNRAREFGASWEECAAAVEVATLAFTARALAAGMVPVQQAISEAGD